MDGRLQGQNSIETGGGSVTVALPSSSNLKVKASTPAGRVENDFGLSTGQDLVGYREAAGVEFERR